MKKTIFTLGILGLTLASCKEDKGPSIEIISPTEGQMIDSSMHHVLLHVNFTDEEGLHEYSADILNSHGDTVYHTMGHEHGTSYALKDSTMLMMHSNHSHHNDLRLDVKVSNHSGLTTVASVNFYKH